MSTTIIAQVTHTELDGTVTEASTLTSGLEPFYQAYVKTGEMTEASVQLLQAERKNAPSATVARAEHIVNKKLAGETLDFLEQKVWQRLVVEVRDQLTTARDSRLPGGLTWLDSVHISQNPTEFANELHAAAQRRGK